MNHMRARAIGYRWMAVLAVSLVVSGLFPTERLVAQDTNAVSLMLVQFEPRERGEALPPSGDDLRLVGPSLLKSHIELINRVSHGPLTIHLIMAPEDFDSLITFRGLSEGHAMALGREEATAAASDSQAFFQPDYWLFVDYSRREGRLTIAAKLRDFANREHLVGPMHRRSTLANSALISLAEDILRVLYRLKTGYERIAGVQKKLALTRFERLTGDTATRRFEKWIPNRLRTLIETSSGSGWIAFPEAPALDESVDEDGLLIDVRTLARQPAYTGVDGILTGSYTVSQDSITIQYELFSRHRRQAVLAESIKGSIGDPGLLDRIVEDIVGRWWTEIVDRLEASPE